MQIQVNTDSSIDGDSRVVEIAEQIVTSAIGHLAPRLTRIELHLTDVNAQKGGSDDIRCMIEARPVGGQPRAVTHNDANIESALRGAARKLRAVLDGDFGKADRTHP